VGLYKKTGRENGKRENHRRCRSLVLLSRLPFDVCRFIHQLADRFDD
jgi:hypothetical protein